MLFLACAYDVDDDPARVRRLAKLIEKAVAFTVSCQTSRGGWGFLGARTAVTTTTRVHDDGAQCSFAARRAGFNVPQDRDRQGRAVPREVHDRNGGVVYTLYGDEPLNNGNVLPLNTAGRRRAVDAEGRPAPYAPAVGDGTRTAGGSADARTSQRRRVRDASQYQMARACCAGRRRTPELEPDARDADLVKWSAFRAPLFKAVKDAQGKDGSWPDLYVSPAYTTAMALVILQLDNGYLPAFSR